MNGWAGDNGVFYFQTAIGSSNIWAYQLNTKKLALNHPIKNSDIKQLPLMAAISLWTKRAFAYFTNIRSKQLQH